MHQEATKNENIGKDPDNSNIPESQMSRKQLNNIYLTKYESFFSRMCFGFVEKLTRRGLKENYDLHNLWELTEEFGSEWQYENLLKKYIENPKKYKVTGVLSIIWKIFHKEW